MESKKTGKHNPSLENDFQTHLVEFAISEQNRANFWQSIVAESMQIRVRKIRTRLLKKIRWWTKRNAKLD